jgi:predicted nucleic-acid-binding Zn-ribbon protein
LLHLLLRGYKKLTEFEVKVLNLLEKINQKLDKLLASNISTSGSMRREDISSGGGYVKPSAVVEKQEEKEKAIEKPPVEGRKICPECGGTEFRTEEDKSQVLFQQGGMKIYSKRYICKKCSNILY